MRMGSKRHHGAFAKRKSVCINTSLTKRKPANAAKWSIKRKNHAKNKANETVNGRFGR